MRRVNFDSKSKPIVKVQVAIILQKVVLQKIVVKCMDTTWFHD